MALFVMQGSQSENFLRNQNNEKGYQKTEESSIVFFVIIFSKKNLYIFAASLKNIASSKLHSSSPQDDLDKEKSFGAVNATRIGKSLEKNLYTEFVIFLS